MSQEDTGLVNVDTSSLQANKESDAVRLPFERDVIEIGRIISGKGHPDKQDPTKLTRHLECDEGSNSILGNVDLTMKAWNPDILVLEYDSKDPKVQIFSCHYILGENVSISFNLTRIPEARRLEKPVGGSREYGEYQDSQGNRYHYISITGKPDQFGPITIQLLNSKIEALLGTFKSTGQVLPKTLDVNLGIPSITEEKH